MTRFGWFRPPRFFAMCVAGHRFATRSERRFARWWTQHALCEIGDDWRL